MEFITRPRIQSSLCGAASHAIGETLSTHGALEKQGEASRFAYSSVAPEISLDVVSVRARDVAAQQKLHDNDRYSVSLRFPWLESNIDAVSELGISSPF